MVILDNDIFIACINAKLTCPIQFLFIEEKESIKSINCNKSKIRNYLYLGPALKGTFKYGCICGLSTPNLSGMNFRGSSHNVGSLAMKYGAIPIFAPLGIILPSARVARAQFFFFVFINYCKITH